MVDFDFFALRVKRKINKWLYWRIAWQNLTALIIRKFVLRLTNSTGSYIHSLVLSAVIIKILSTITMINKLLWIEIYASKRFF
jgi:hypothetical protein